MSNIKGLRESWSGYLSKYQVPSDYKIIDSHEFNAYIDTLLTALINDISSDIYEKRIPNSLKAPNEIADFLRKRHEGLLTTNPGQIRSLKRNYNSLYREYRNLVNRRKQDNWSSSIEHLKTLIYRILTMFVIVSGILLTGYLSKIWDIPIPIFRAIPL